MQELREREPLHPSLARSHCPSPPSLGDVAVHSSHALPKCRTLRRLPDCWRERTAVWPWPGTRETALASWAGAAPDKLGLVSAQAQIFLHL